MNKSEIILLAKQTERRAVELESFDRSHFNVQVVENTAEAIQLSETSEADTLVHILEDFQRMDVGYFHHRLIRRPKSKIRHVFIVYRGQNTRAMAFANDCGMRRALQSEIASQTLGGAVKLAVNAFDALGSDAQQAMHLANSGDFEFDAEQISLIDSVARLYEGLHPVQLAHAHAFIERGDCKKAANIARKILSQDSRHVRAMTVLADSLSACGQSADALRVLYAAEGLSAGNPKRLALLGRLLSQSGDRASALKCLFGSVQIYPVVSALQPLIRHLQLSEDERNLFFQTALSSGCGTEVLERLHKIVSDSSS